jgi:hypothetical protein
MNRHIFRSTTAAWLAIFAMLCQAILPTVVYHQASTDSKRLLQISRAFGGQRFANLDQDVHAHHHHESGDANPVHNHGIHCALCLADLMHFALPVFYFPPLVVLPIFNPTYFVFESSFSPTALGTPLARGPPHS